MRSKPASEARRTYRSPRREQQAAETRSAVLAAAGRLFAERGWSTTGMRAVAQAAGVAVETVYANFPSKADLLLAAIDVGVVGDVAPAALAERPEFTALGVGSREQRAQAAARLVTRIQRRSAALHRALREAAAGDRELAARMREAEERRRLSVEQGIGMVAARPLTEQERDGLWAVLAAEIYWLLIELSGWTPEQYESWLADTILRLLDD